MESDQKSQYYCSLLQQYRQALNINKKSQIAIAIYQTNNPHLIKLYKSQIKNEAQQNLKERAISLKKEIENCIERQQIEINQFLNEYLSLPLILQQINFVKDIRNKILLIESKNLQNFQKIDKQKKIEEEKSLFKKMITKIQNIKSNMYFKFNKQPHQQQNQILSSCCGFMLLKINPQSFQYQPLPQQEYQIDNT